MSFTPSFRCCLLAASLAIATVSYISWLAIVAPTSIHSDSGSTSEPGDDTKSSVVGQSPSQSYDDTESWETQFISSSPDTYYGSYSAVRNSCKWSRPVPIVEHIKSNVEAGYPDRSTWGGQYGLPGEAKSMKKYLKVTTCRHLSSRNEEYVITRVGSPDKPFRLKPGEIFIISLVLSRPSNLLNGTRGQGGNFPHLVESMDAYFAPNGEQISYPPIHPHHSNAYMTGHPAETTAFGQGKLKNFTPLPLIPSAEFRVGRRNYPASGIAT